MIWNKLIEVWRAPLVSDAYGQYRDWDRAMRVLSAPASVQPLNSEEAVAFGERETTVTRRKVYLRRFDVESHDRLLIDGEWWEVYGEPFTWAYPALTQYTRLIVRRVEDA